MIAPNLTLAERIISFALEYERVMNLGGKYSFIDKSWWEHKIHMFPGDAVAQALKETRRVKVYDDLTEQYIFATVEVIDWWRQYENDSWNQAECPVYFFDLTIKRFNGELLLEIGIACRMEYP